MKFQSRRQTENQYFSTVAFTIPYCNLSVCLSEFPQMENTRLSIGFIQFLIHIHAEEY